MFMEVQFYGPDTRPDVFKPVIGKQTQHQTLVDLSIYLSLSLSLYIYIYIYIYI